MKTSQILGLNSISTIWHVCFFFFNYGVTKILLTQILSTLKIFAYIYIFQQRDIKSNENQFLFLKFRKQLNLNTVNRGKSINDNDPYLFKTILSNVWRKKKNRLKTYSYKHFSLLSLCYFNKSNNKLSSSLSFYNINRFNSVFSTTFPIKSVRKRKSPHSS